jgi:hypothetical protein
VNYTPSRYLTIFLRAMSVSRRIPRIYRTEEHMKHQSTMHLPVIRTMLMVSLGLGLAFSASAGDSPVVYVVTGSQQFGTVNLATGAFRQISTTPEGQANLVQAPGGFLYSLTVSGYLVTIDPSTGATSYIGSTGLGFEAFAFAGLGGRLYATDFSGNLYSVDPGTGKATLIITTLIPPDPAVPGSPNPDGTINFCDESLYLFAGKLYATFDSFTVSPTSLAITPTISPWLYRIDPTTGVTTRVAPTALNLGSSVEVDGTFYGFKLVFTSFTEFGPQAYSQVVTLDPETGNTKLVANVDAAAGAIFGAAPAPSQRQQR